VKINTARSEAICKAVKKNKFGSEIRFENNARCPDEDIGRNSVAACMIARKISDSMNG